MNLKESVRTFIHEKKGYYKQWVFDQPVVLSFDHNQKLQQLQKVMQKLISHFVTNYEDFEQLMPVSAPVKEVLKLYRRKPYKIGTYRTDFVYDKNNNVRLLEITCRFALNGMFLSAIMNEIAEDIQKSHSNRLKLQDLYSPIFNHLKELIGEAKKVVVLKGRDNRNESKLFIPIFIEAGLTIEVIELDQIDHSKSVFENSFIISELGLEEILGLSSKTIESLANSNMINDFRTVFLIHDKRFFSVLYNQEFRSSILTKEEESFFKDFLIPTYSYRDQHPMWCHARAHKDQWVIKHATLGKSQQVYAGIVTSQTEWESLFLSDMNNMVLQKWVETERVSGSINDQPYLDYLTGTLIFFDHHYFGLGDFRTSSFPVTNKTDHRKACTFILSDKTTPEIPNLKYIHG